MQFSAGVPLRPLEAPRPPKPTREMTLTLMTIPQQQRPLVSGKKKKKERKKEKSRSPNKGLKGPLYTEI